MDLRRYLQAIRKNWWIVVVLVLAFSGGAYYYSKRQTPIYASHLTFYVGTPSITDTTANSTNQFAQDRAISYAELVSTDRVAELVVNSTHLPLTPAQVSQKISAAAQLNTVIIDVTVKDPSPSRAEEIAGAVGTVFPGLVRQLDSTNTKSSPVKLSVVSGPTAARSPVSPRTKLIVGLGFVIGLLVGLAVAAVRELLDVSVRTAEALAELSQVPVLGTVAFDSTVKSEPLVINRHALSPRAEALRQVRTNLEFLDATSPARLVVVTSSVGSEGKTTTACNLAIVIAEAKHSVLLIEADLRRPAASDLLGLERGVGLSTVLSGQVDLDDAIQRWGSGDLSVLPSGLIPPNPSELLGSVRMTELLKQVRSQFDFVLIDTPPLLPVTDAAVIAASADGVLLVFRHGKTRRAQLLEAMRALTAVHARVLGTVLNMRPTRRRDRRGYAAYYHRPASRRSGRAWRPARNHTDGVATSVAKDVPEQEPSRR